jgi:hypothetical protein
MTPIEELLRSATRQAAAEIAPESIEPLEVRTLRRPRAARRATPRLAVPLAAAAAVIVAVGLTLAIPRALESSSAPAGQPVSTGASAAPQPATSGPSKATVRTPVPAVYAALTGVTYPWYAHPLNITARDTMTGSVLATVRPPAPYGTFALVAHGDSAGTFLVGVQPWQPVSNAHYSDNNNAAPITLLLLHFDPATRKTSFTRLPVPTLAGQECCGLVLEGASLSPDGTRLAVAIGNDVPPAPTTLRLSVYSLPGGTVRTWSLRGKAVAGSQDGVAGMSWLADGHTLALNITGVDTAGMTVNVIRKLDVTGPGGDLLSDSSVVFSLNDRTSQFLCMDSLALSPDGTTVACAGQVPPPGWGKPKPHHAVPSPGATANPPSSVAPPPNIPASPANVYGVGVFSVATGNLTAVLARTVDPSSQGVNQLLYWWDGHDTLIASLDGPVFTLRGGTQHPIPWDRRISPPPGGTNAAAW